MMVALHRSEITVGAAVWKTAALFKICYAPGWFSAEIRGVHLVYHGG
jgi:hypothetical protein